LTAACCPRRDFYDPPPFPSPKGNATDFCTALCLLVLAIRRQNLGFVLRTKKIFSCTPKSLAAACCPKRDLERLLHPLLWFWCTFSGFDALSHTFSSFGALSPTFSSFGALSHTFSSFGVLSHTISTLSHNFHKFWHTFSGFGTLSYTFSGFGTLSHTLSSFGILSQVLAHFHRHALSHTFSVF